MAMSSRASRRATGAASLAMLAAFHTLPAWAQSDAPAKPRCTGTPPSGELTAQRIVSTTRTEAGLFEGPVWANGALYFSDFTFGPGFPSRIQKLSADGSVTTVIDDSGSNGLAVDARGTLVSGNHKHKGLVRFDIATGQRSTIVSQYQGKVFNSPNDVAIAADGTLYFTDPSYQQGAAPGGQPTTNVYRVATDGSVSVVDNTLTQPNGVSLSPTGDELYVATGSGTVRAYRIHRGAPQPGRDFLTGLKGPDGMTVDCHGNLYVTEHGAQRVRVFSPTGKQLATIKVDANITNAAFGGTDGKTLFLTGAGAVWQVPLGVSGSPY